MALANPLETFVWGANGARKTPEQIARDREIADALMAQGYDTSPVGHWMEGLARVANVASGKIREGRANSAEKTNASESQKRIAALLGGSAGGASAFPPAPASPTPVAAGAAPSSFRAAQETGASPDLKTGIVSTAEALGIDPVDLATAISYETAGTFDPTKAGPTTQWGQHRGLIQFGEPQAQKYGVDWSNPVGSQLGPDGAVAKYLRDTGVQPGMGLLDIYSAINAGGVGRYDRSDANNGGAPGTVADKVNSQMAGHRQKAMALLGQGGPSDAQAALESMAVGQSMPMAPGADTGLPEMAGNSAAQPVQVAQAGGIDPAIIEALSSPYASDAEKRIAGALLEQQMQRNDPMRQMEMERAQLELNALRNPTPEAFTLSEGQVRYGPDGSILARGAEKAPELPSGVREYEYARQQGFPGTFQDWEASKKGGMSLQVDPATGTVSFQQGGNIKPLTEGQSKDTVYSTRAQGALPLIDQFGDALTSFPERMADWLPGGAGNFVQTPEYQQAKQAGDEFLQAILRKDTGAAITSQEQEMYGKTYLPQPGDSAPVLQQKKVSRTRALEAIKAGMPPQAILNQEKALRNTEEKTLGSGQPPAGVTPEEWSVMTPEERALWN